MSSESSSSSSSSICIDPNEGGTVGGTYYLIGTVLPAGQTTPFDTIQRRFSAGEYEVTFLGYQMVVPNRCESTDNNEFSLAVTIREPVSDPIPFDLTTFDVYDYTQGSTKRWWPASGNMVNEGHNGASTFLVSSGNYINTTFSVHITGHTQTPGADIQGDYIGVAFGFSGRPKRYTPPSGAAYDYNRPDSYYLLCWKGDTQNCPWNSDADDGTRGLRLLKVTNTWSASADTEAGNNSMQCTLWKADEATIGSGRIVRLGFLDVSWHFEHKYDFMVTHKSNGWIYIKVRDMTDKVDIWDFSIKDTSPLGAGKFALYNQSQSDVDYEANILGTTTFLHEYAGRACTYEKDSLTMNGSLGGIGVMIPEGESIIETYSGRPGDSPTFTLPTKHIIFNDNSGSLAGSGGYTYNAPWTVAKTFNVTDPKGVDHTYTIPTGTRQTIDQYHVSDFPAGFVKHALGDPIPINWFRSKGWLDANGDLRFKFVYIPCGRSAANINITQVATYVPPPITTYDWKITNCYGTPIGIAPTVVGSSVIVNNLVVGNIGIRWDTTPTGLYDPYFRIRQKSLLRPICGQPAPIFDRGFRIGMRYRDTIPYLFVPINPSDLRIPKQAGWVQYNTTLKSQAYRFVIQVGDYVFDTAYGDDMKYFRFNDVMWTPGEKVIKSHESATIRFLLPFDTEEAEAHVAPFIDGEQAAVITVPLGLRVYTHRELKVHRDLITSDIRGCCDTSPTVRTVAMRRNVATAGYDPYIYHNQELFLVDWGTSVKNGDSVVCISKAIKNIDLVSVRLKMTKGILPRRYVQI